MSDPSSHYTEESFWGKIAKFAKKAGVSVIDKALVLYFCMNDGDTPAWAKAVILGALGYFIWPLDAIPDPTPGIGFSDDLGVLLVAISTVISHIKDEHRKMARKKLRDWFGDHEM